MHEYKTPADYLNAVKAEIKWKRAQDSATREISDHINDLYSCLIDSGHSEEEALEMAINEMGDARVVGSQLNAVHKPKTNWPLILIASALLIIGFLMKVLLYPGGIGRQDFLAVGLGIICTIILYFSDYTVLIRRPRLLYWLLFAATIISMAYEFRNGLHIASYHNSYFLLLLFPILLVGIALHIKTNNYHLGLVSFSLYFLPAVLCAVLIESPTAIVYLSSSYILFAAYLLKHQWVETSILSLAAAACVIAIVLVGIAFLLFQFDIGGSLSSVQESFTKSEAVKILAGIPLLGSYSGNLSIVQDYWNDYPLLFLAAKYGAAVFLLGGAIYAGLLLLMLRVTQKQTTTVGTLISWAVLLCAGFQLLLSILCNLGVVNGAFMMSFPFFVGGGSYTVFNFILTGILLSVSRNEDIAKDWIKFKETAKKSGVAQ